MSEPVLRRLREGMAARRAGEGELGVILLVVAGFKLWHLAVLMLTLHRQFFVCSWNLNVKFLQQG